MSREFDFAAAKAMREKVEAMHGAYLAATGFPPEVLRLNYNRELAWAELVTREYTPADVRLVVDFIKRGIRRRLDGKANPRNNGALSFSNLIGNPDKFDEELAGAMLEKAAKAPEAIRKKAPPPAGARPQGEKEKQMLTPEEVRMELAALRGRGSRENIEHSTSNIQHGNGETLTHS